MSWPRQLLAVVSFLATGVIFSPESFGSKSDGQISTKLATYLRLAHLLSFSTALGTALWVTFVAVVVNFGTLIPRHLFGNLRSKLFPASFILVGICCAISAGSFGYLHPWKSSSTAEKFQLGLLLSSFAFNLSNLFLFGPMTIEMMKKRHKVERELCIGEEIGWSKNTEVAMVNTKLAAVNRKFRMIHGVASLAHVMFFATLIMHSWHLAGNFIN
ncbi:uncharacterized protein LOC132168401 [Corylus avellana]|uniref:uncharacterized protein LOC132168401 n=1 Tax=Corylus avellana TaxID=13451 RepID=UPI00286AFD7D|nr:uncharacterized protein LOC132168401 [Corylus avellana]